MVQVAAGKPCCPGATSRGRPALHTTSCRVPSERTADPRAGLEHAAEQARCMGRPTVARRAGPQPPAVFVLNTHGGTPPCAPAPRPERARRTPWLPEI